MPSVFTTRYLGEAMILPENYVIPWARHNAGGSNYFMGDYALKILAATDLYWDRTSTKCNMMTMEIELQFWAPFDKKDVITMFWRPATGWTRYTEIYWDKISLIVQGQPPVFYYIDTPATFWLTYHKIRTTYDSMTGNTRVYLDDNPTEILAIDNFVSPCVSANFEYHASIISANGVWIRDWAINDIGAFPPSISTLTDIDYKIYITELSANPLAPTEVNEVSDLVSPFEIILSMDEKTPSTRLNVFNDDELYTNKFNPRDAVEIWVRETHLMPWVKLFVGAIEKRRMYGNFIELDVKGYANDLITKGKCNIWFRKTGSNNSYVSAGIENLIGTYPGTGEAFVTGEHQFNYGRGYQPQFLGSYDDGDTYLGINNWFNDETYLDIIKQLAKMCDCSFKVNDLFYNPSCIDPFGRTGIYLLPENPKLIFYPRPDIDDFDLIGIDIRQDTNIIDPSVEKDLLYSRTKVGYFAKDEFETPIWIEKTSPTHSDGVAGLDREGEMKDYIDSTDFISKECLDNFTDYDFENLSRIRKPSKILCRALASNQMIGKIARVWAPKWGMGSGTDEAPIYETFEIKGIRHIIGGLGGWTTELDLQYLPKKALDILMPFVEKTEDKIGSAIYEYPWIYALHFVSGSTWKIQKCDIQFGVWEDVYTVDFSQAPFSNASFYPLNIAHNLNDDYLYLIGRRSEFDNHSSMYKITRDPQYYTGGWVAVGIELTADANARIMDLTIIPNDDGSVTFLQSAMAIVSDLQEGWVYASQDFGDSWGVDWIAPPTLKPSHGVNTQISGICWDKNFDKAGYFVVASSGNMVYQWFRIYSIRFGKTDAYQFESYADQLELWQKELMWMDSLSDTTLCISPLIADAYYFTMLRIEGGNEETDTIMYKDYIQNKRGICFVPRTVVKCV